MKDLLNFIISEITQSDDFIIEEKEEDGRINFTIKIDQKLIGIVIGKNGNTIRSIRNIVRAKSILEKKSVFIEVVEK